MQGALRTGLVIFLAAGLPLPAGVVGQEPVVTVMTERGFIGEIAGVSDGDQGSGCERSLLVERREGTEPFPNWALTEYAVLRVCVGPNVQITIWSESGTPDVGSVTDLRLGMLVYVSVGEGVFMTEPPSVDAVGVQVRGGGAGGTRA